MNKKTIKEFLQKEELLYWYNFVMLQNNYYFDSNLPDKQTLYNASSYEKFLNGWYVIPKQEKEENAFNTFNKQMRKNTSSYLYSILVRNLDETSLS